LRHVIHGILAVLTLLVVLGKAWITRRKIRWGMRRILVLGWLVFSLQSTVFVSATVFAIWARLAGRV